LHRVKAASWALKLAAELADLAELQRVYFAVKPLLNEDIVNPLSRLEVEVVYNTMCGDLREAVRLARERVAVERVEGTPFLLIPAMTNLSLVLCRTGPAEETIRVLREAYDIAIQNKLVAASRDCACRLAAFLFDGGHRGVKEWMQRATMVCHGEATQTHIPFTLNIYFARIALLENRVADANRILEHDCDWEWLRHRPRFLAPTLVLRIRVQIAQGASVADVGPNVEQLRHLYAHTAMLGGEDYEVAGLCAGLLYMEDKESAGAYLADYLSHKRRDLTQYSRELIEICQNLHRRPERHQPVLLSS
jgi:hypothetical protein